jgi:prolyl-tRNA synthetase
VVAGGPAALRSLAVDCSDCSTKLQLIWRVYVSFLMKIGLCTRVARSAKIGVYTWHSYDAKAPVQRVYLVEQRRLRHNDGRNRCSSFWIPPINLRGDDRAKTEKEDSNALLVRGGFIRQAYSGLFHLLPLGLRVQDKIEHLVDQHMRRLQASKVSLSSLSSQDLWSRSGRLGGGTELFKFADRKDSKWLLSPTHEEEITTLVRSLVQSYRDLPIRLYQISRKYRDEPRPRQGLLRGREFLMKDLYTFDVDIPTALRTYEDVRNAYNNFFDELKMPYIVAKADSGTMGGDLSHEYHLPSEKGEDTIISCSNCNYVRNEELVEDKKVLIRPLSPDEEEIPGSMKQNLPLKESIFITNDKHTLVKAFCNKSLTSSSNGTADCEVNPYAVKAVLPDVALGFENPSEQFTTWNPKGDSILYIFDHQIHQSEIEAKLAIEHAIGKHEGRKLFVAENGDGGKGIPGLVKVQTGDECPACSKGQVTVQKAIEIGHTFYLGTRYSEALDAKVAVQPGADSQHEAFMQMGCHGIGVSRLIAATASALSDDTGLNWPRVLAPFEVIIMSHQPSDVNACLDVYDSLLEGKPACNDAIVDDRDKNWLYKLREADLVGYPVIIFLGRAWKERGEYEVQCRRLGVKQDVTKEDLPQFVRGLLHQL